LAAKIQRAILNDLRVGVSILLQIYCFLGFLLAGKYNIKQNILL